MDENIRIEIMVLIIGVIIGGGLYLANSLILYNMSMNKERTDIAESLYLDVSSFGDYLIAIDREFLANPSDAYIFVQQTPIYPDNGLYFAFQRDISKMDRKVAQDTFTFYYHLLAAERGRNLIYEIQRLSDLRERTKAEQRRQQILTRTVAQEVNISVSLLPALKQELDAAR